MKTEKRYEIRRKAQKLSKIRKAVLAVLSCLTVFCVVYALILPAMTAGNKETEAETENISENNVPDMSADTESPDIWEKSLPALKGDVKSDVRDVALSQTGYRESKKNFIIAENGEKKGYSRYGQWADDPYGDWNIYFAKFVMTYADVPSGLYENCSDAAGLMAVLQADGRFSKTGEIGKNAGNLVFFDCGEKCLAGIVSDESKNGSVDIVTGDFDDKVEIKTLETSSEEIRGYGILSENADKNFSNTEKSPVTVTARADLMPLPRMRTLFKVAPDGAQPKAAAPEGNTSDMSDMIDSVTIQYCSDDGVWKDLYDGAVIKDGDKIQFSVDYTVPGHTLSPENDTIYYQIPAGLKYKVVESGIVFNNEGHRVGTYSINDSGFIEIKFDSEYVTRNDESGHKIKGYISFSAIADRSQLGEDELLELDFSDILHITVKVEENVTVKGDIHTQKQAEKTPDGLIKYTVFVTSAEGTYGPVSIEDTMTNASYFGSLEVRDGNNAVITPSVIPAAGTKNFTFTLPQMEAGSIYTITYFGKPDGVKTALDILNKAESSSVNSENITISSEAEVKTYYELVKKKGVFNADSKTITWTITLNSEGLDISNCVLTDKITIGFNTTEYTGNVSISSSSGETVETALPYTFPEGSADVYTVTFETPADTYQVGENYIYNKAFLHLDGTEVGMGMTGVGIGDYTPFEKTGGTAVREGGTYILPWNVDFDFTSIGLEEAEGKSFRVSDVLDQSQGEQYFTREQLEALKTAAANAFTAEGINIPDSEWKVICVNGTQQSWDYVSPDGKYQGYSFLISAKDDFPTKGKTISFGYESTAVPEDMSKTAVFVNRIGSNNRFSVAEIIVESEKITLEKIDPAYPSENNSEHFLRDLENHELVWKISLFVPESQRDKEITLTEYIPANTDFVSLSLVPGNDFTRHCSSTDPDNMSLIWWGGALKGVASIDKTDRSQIKITLSPELNQIAGDVPYTLFVKVKLKDLQIPWADEGMTRKAAYKNTVTAENENGTVTDSQTQIVVKHRLENLVTKTGLQEQSTNTVSYSVLINPDRLNLLPNKTELTLTDTLTYVADRADFQAQLIPGTVAVYERNPDGTLGSHISAPHKYTVSYDEAAKRHVHTIKITVPDDRPLVLKYKYRFMGKISAHSPVTNKAVLEGMDEIYNNVTEDIEVHIQESGATAVIQGISFYKVDENDNGLFLEGAQFRISRWDESTSSYVTVTDKHGNDIFVSDGNGCILITAEHISSLEYNKAYKIEEITAPDGYFRNPLPYYFIIEDEDVVSHPVCAPADFDGYRLTDGNAVYYGNIRKDTEITVKKNWQKQNGDPITADLPESITVDLYQRTASGVGRIYNSYVITPDTDWTLEIKDLPAFEINADKSKGEEYFYYISERGTEGFEVIYGNNGGINSGEITVTNRRDTSYVLPETGGKGTAFYTVCGILLIFVSVMFAVIRKKKS